MIKNKKIEALISCRKKASWKKRSFIKEKKKKNQKEHDKSVIYFEAAWTLILDTRARGE